MSAPPEEIWPEQADEIIAIIEPGDRIKRRRRNKGKTWRELLVVVSVDRRDRRRGVAVRDLRDGRYFHCDLTMKRIEQVNRTLDADTGECVVVWPPKSAGHLFIRRTEAGS